jgi:hypothetical protein
MAGNGGQQVPAGVSGTSSITFGVDRARPMAWRDVQNTDINSKTGPYTDPTHSDWIHRLDMSNQFRLMFGKVVDSTAYVNCYKVQPEHGHPALYCTAASFTALQPIGARQLGQIAIGSSVVFALHPTDTTGLILGVYPDIQTNSRSAFADFISQQARAGLLVDAAHNYSIQQADAQLIPDWSAGRPLDATT